MSEVKVKVKEGIGKEFLDVALDRRPYLSLRWFLAKRIVQQAMGFRKPSL